MDLQISKISDSKPDIFKNIYTPTSVSKMMRQNALKVPRSAFQQSDITLAKIKKQFGEEISTDYIKKFVIDLNKFMFRDTSKMMTPFQVDQIAEIILDDFYYFNILEIGLCFSQIKSGKLGKMYGELTGQYILECFEAYRKSRLKALDDIDNDKKQELFAKEEAANNLRLRALK